MALQTKLIGVNGLQLKLNEGARTFEGYASTFGNVDTYNDTIAKGAYLDTLKDRQRPVQMRWNHYGPIIGKWLKMEEDSTGLFVAGSMTPGHSVAEDAYASLKHEAIDGLSIGYYVQSYNMRDNIRELTGIELIEISVVEEPADNFARIDSVKSMLDEARSLAEVEDFLRDAYKFSRSNATALVSRIKTISRGDHGVEPEQLKSLFDSFRANT